MKQSKSFSITTKNKVLLMNSSGVGYKMFSDDNREPKCGYLRPLMIVVIDNR